MSKQTLKKIAIYTLGAISGVAISLSLPSMASTPKQEALPIQSLKTMAEVYSQIKANYVTAESDEKLLENAMKGMVSGLDPHSEYMDKKGYEELQESTSGEFGGLGMEIGQEDGFIKIIAPIEDTPAERAGLKSGDLIVKINNESTRGMTTTQAVKKMRGTPGTKITITVSRKDSNKPLVVNLTRAMIKVKSVRWHLLEADYGYVRISQFQEPTVRLMVDAVLALEKENKAPLKGLILDLRDDPGGLLSGAVGVSAAFLKGEHTVVSTKGRDNKDSSVLKAGSARQSELGTLPASVKNIPLTVLINSGSASASEIVAGALQDHKRAVIVGTRSFGKGSVQTVMPLSNGGAMKITTALYYTPKDRSIQATGILPDVEVQDKNRTMESREADLAGHIHNPLGNEEVNGGVLEHDTAAQQAATASAPAAEKAKDKDDEDVSSRRKPNPEKDDQLRKALELVKQPSEWKKSLGLAAKKPVPKKDQDDDKEQK